jgi:hypothetical protein
MTQGVWTKKYERFPTKKALREAIQAGSDVALESTSMFGNEYGGWISQHEGDATFTVVGPDPYTSRKWYAQIIKKGDTITVK